MQAQQMWFVAPLSSTPLLVSPSWATSSTSYPWQPKAKSALHEA
jgi:hypothetical protein